MGFLEIAGLVLGGLLTVAGAVTTIVTCAEKIAKVRKVAKAPNDRQDERLAALEKWREDVDRKLNSDLAELEEIHKVQRIGLQAQLALLDHSLDGNNVEQMQDARKALLKQLINNQ